MTEVSGNPADLMDLVAMQDEPLHPDLVDWIEETEFGPMLKHPLVYAMFPINGMCNRIYANKRTALAEAIEASDWHHVVFLHERPYRFRALVDYVTGRYEADDEGPIIPLDDLHLDRRTDGQDTLDLVADVWVDSENISEHIEDWRTLFGKAETFFLGTYSEQLEFAALPDPIPAYRAGIEDGDWSWSTKRGIAEFFARRLRAPENWLPVVERAIPKSECFGYLTRRGENELLVRVS